MQDNGEIRFIRKRAADGGPSLTGGCPALFAAPDGGHFVQYLKITDPAVLARLRTIGEANDCPLADGEDYGYLPPGVIEGNW